jgi:hypothetical protein
MPAKPKIKRLIFCRFNNDSSYPRHALRCSGTYLLSLSCIGFNLQKLLGKLAVTEAQQRRMFFEKQLGQVKDKMVAAETALRGTGVSCSALKSNPTSAVAAVAGLQAQVTPQEVKLGAMRGYLAETAPDFKQALKELAKVDESRDGAVIQVLDAAQPPEKKAKPQKALIAIIATLAAGFALLLFVFVCQALRNARGDQQTAGKLAQIKSSWLRALGKA